MSRKRKHHALLCICLVMMLIIVAGCGKSDADGNGQKAENSTSIKEMNPEDLDEITMDALTTELMRQMTLEEKIGQLFIVNTDSLDFNAERKMTETMEENLKKYQPGGVIFFSFNLKNKKQTTKFIADMQGCTKIPMFMSVDEEGGSVARIANTQGMKTTKFPSMAEIGKTGDAKEAYQVGSTIGREIHEMGFNLDFAPVADLSTNVENTEIGERSFGSDAALVSEMVGEEVKGLQENGVSATLKHFPGQGNCEEDTHRGYAELNVTIDRLRDTEFKPFAAGISAGADFVMMSHVSVRSITQNEVPASLSSLMVKDILREELKFKNIIITDAMNMKIITKFYDAGQAALMAVRAGNDMILMPDDFAASCEALKKAVQEGELSEKTIDQAVARILSVKIRRGIIPLDSPMLVKIVGNE